MDKLRDGINRILFHILSNEERADKIMELIAPELEKAAKWEKLMTLFDTSCDKCFLRNVCGTRGIPEAVCDDIKDALNQPEVKK